MKARNKFFIGIMIVFLMVIMYFLFNKQINWLFSQNLDLIKEYIVSFGVWAPIIYIILMMLAIVISTIPSLPLSVIAGVIWGPFLATVYSVIGASLGAIIAFMIARFMGRTLLKNYYSKYLNLFDKTSENYLMLIIFGMRLIPLFQFDIISYGAGFTKIKLWKFSIATILGMIPMTFLFVYLGTNLFGNWKILLITTIFITILIVLPFFIKGKIFKAFKKT